MLLASWNVNSIAIRLPQVLAWLTQVNPDVLCLQETKTVDEKFPREAFEAAGYQSQFFGERTYNGVAIISKLPLVNVQKGFIEEDDPRACRFIEALAGPLYVLNAYIPNGQSVGSDKYEYKLRWLRALKSHLATNHDPNTALALCGDFNIAPEDRDVYKPEEVGGSIMCSETERQALALIKEWGFEDAFRLHNQSAGEFSWWDYRMGAFRRNMGFRIDHIWATKPAALTCNRAWIDKAPRKQERPSDHAPVIAEFTM
jgi:exodeoxyribonuclease III